MWGDREDHHDKLPPPVLLKYMSVLEGVFKNLTEPIRSSQEKILVELDSVRHQVEQELKYLNDPTALETDKRRRLTYLFVKDLVDGVHGKILDRKDTRDNTRKNQVSLAAKAATCVVLFVVCVAMLFYLYLFSILQTVGAQKAWLNSFLLWLFLEIVFVSTGLVLFDHVVIPLWSMRKVQRVKDQIVQVLTCRDSVANSVVYLTYSPSYCSALLSC
jgi:hypothetical protein